MGITFSRDSFSQITPPTLTLCKANGERIGVIPVTEFTRTENFNDLDVINFSTPLFIDESENLVYDQIVNMKYIEVGNGLEIYCIINVSTNSEGTHQETKTVEAKSLEVVLAQRYLELFKINTGEVESIDGVKFYNPADTSHSLMHLVLAKATGWSMGHVPSDLYSVQRSFNQERISIYDFLMNDVAESFDVHFTFDSYNKRINVYHLDTYGENTNIHVSYNNLLKSTDMSCNTDDIKTCITMTGDDDLTVREINMGSEDLVNLDYYCTTEFWSEGLVTAYNAWKVKYAQNLPTYTTLLASYQNLIDQILTEQTNKFPETDNWEQWVNMNEATAKSYMRQYSYDHLEEKKKAYEQKQTVMQKSGWGVSSSTYYNSKYLPVYNVITWCTQVLVEKQTTINNLKAQQAGIMSQMQAIMNVVAMRNNFTAAQLEELSMFIREDELTSENYLITESMTTTERFEMLNDMIEFGRKELQRVSTPQLTFSADLVNLFEIPEFDEYSGDFDVGNYIYVTLRDDYNIKAKLLSVHYNFYDSSDFSATFGNIVRKEKNVFTDIQDAINSATSAATSVSFNQSYWSESSRKATDIDKALEEGLTRAGYVLTDGTGTDAVWDERGLFLNTQATRADGTADPHPNDSIFLGGGRILFTQDKWKTVETALGRIALYTQNNTTGQTTITPDGTFGLLAKQVVAGQIYGSEFIGGSVKSSNYIGNVTTPSYASQGTYINLTSGWLTTKKFYTDTNGNAFFKGGMIGGYIKSDNHAGAEFNDYTTAGTYIHLQYGSISTPQFYLGTGGSAHFKGTIEGGAIKSANHEGTAWNGYSTAGTYMNLSLGTISTPQFYINQNGDTHIKGTIEGGAIKSANHTGTAWNGYSTTGSYMNLSLGTISTPNFYINQNGAAYFRGTITGSTLNLGGGTAGNNGSINIYDDNNTAIGWWNSGGLVVKKGTISGSLIQSYQPNTNNDTFTEINGGKIYVKTGQGGENYLTLWERHRDNTGRTLKIGGATVSLEGGPYLSFYWQDLFNWFAQHVTPR